MTTASFAITDPEAKEKFVKHQSTDPFPDIPPALLNSADIYDYVRETGMIHPFDRDEEKLKPASYEVPFSGTIISWDSGKKFTGEIKVGDKYKLKKNSIVFVWTDTVFRLPDYIALRFNLTITYVHRGLLLGTGPLIDPGFVGRILIPLHNLTSEDYEMVGGEGIIWVEFTKLSPNKRWNNESIREETNYRSFPQDKKNREPHYYFEKASNNQPIQSSIPGEIKVAKEDSESSKKVANEAKDTVDRVLSYVRIGTLIGVISVVIGIASILISTHNLISATNARIDIVISRMSALEATAVAKSEVKTDTKPENISEPKSLTPAAPIPKQSGESQAKSTESKKKNRNRGQ